MTLKSYISFSFNKLWHLLILHKAERNKKRGIQMEKKLMDEN